MDMTVLENTTPWIQQHNCDLNLLYKFIDKIKDKLNAINKNMSNITTNSVCGRDARIYIFKLKDKSYIKAIGQKN